MRLARLWRMPPHELAFRGREQAWRWLDRLAPAGRRAPAGDAAGLRRAQRELQSRFFAGAVSDETPALLWQIDPQGVAQVLARAEAAGRGRFDLLGYRALDCGQPIDWHRDPLSGRRAPRRHWSRLRPLEARQVGDCKLTWELNRHQWMVTLGQAYRLSGEERYAETFARCLRGWLRENPRGRGLNWTSSLELALRLIAWCWSLVLFRGSPELGPDLFEAARDGLGAQAAHVARFLSSYFSPNTHLTGEALGLFYAGLLFPELPQAAAWRRTGHDLLVEELERQVLDDGVYFEQASAYQCYTVEIYLHFLLLCAQSGLELPARVGARVQALLDFLLCLRRPDGELPAIGDADGGRLLPLAARGPLDPRGLFAVAAALFGRADYAWAAGGAAPELLWLLGPDGLEAFEALEPRPPAGPPSRVFASGGYAVFRSGWERTAHQLVFDAGPLGCPTSGAHGHADLLSVQVSAFGQAFLVDPGTYVYTADARLRDHFRGSRAHSTVTLDGLLQARPAGPFAWRERPAARLEGWALGPRLDFAGGRHEAYAGLPGAPRHRRRVLFVERRLFVLIDDLEGAGERLVEQRFQFAPLSVAAEPAGWVCARGEQGVSLWLRSHAAVPLALTIQQGVDEPPAGWVSPDYGQRVPAPLVTWSVRARLPLRVVTVIVPCAGAESLPPAVGLLWGPDGAPAGLAVGPEGERILFAGEAPAPA